MKRHKTMLAKGIKHTSESAFLMHIDIVAAIERIKRLDGMVRGEES